MPGNSGNDLGLRCDECSVYHNTMLKGRGRVLDYITGTGGEWFETDGYGREWALKLRVLYGAGTGL